ncbi:hypothetical protein GEV33_000449 [Tenebrio molitor]|uniref:Uncharacterized protein n=1 Tax=Tenebrio molitor TaxID=7067 RepID=A0A8J6HY29_TENMO|nr:hypothetical protein GEV33_000449 [Tenebrio molitor]
MTDGRSLRRAGLFTLEFTDREIHGCCCGNVSDLERFGHHEQKEEGWGKEEKKITFRQVTGTKGNRN